jgi:hypothetical protein
MKPTSPLAYVPWHLRDLFTRALVPLLFILLLGGLPFAARAKTVGVANVTDPGQLEFLRMLWVNLGPVCMLLGSFLFMTNSIATDRQRQHVRFQFAHPVSPTLHYLTRFVAGLLLYIACFAPLPLLLATLGTDIAVVKGLVAAVATLVLIGGLSALCGALTEKEGALLIGVFMLTQLLQDLAAQDILPKAAATVARGLPPIRNLSYVNEQLFTGQAWPANDLLLVFGYGLGMLAAALLIVRRAPLVR